ncbi:hypothetical protein AX14_001144 [Amanita brunnescens Koide BX004]|nr:hypothetical protein AX14_001144 [Amanita brunnescens Koide BX004]
MIYPQKPYFNLQISLFLSPDEVINDSESLLVWDVVKIGHSRREFTAYCPVIRGTSDGQIKIGFATVEEEELAPDVKRFKAVDYHVAPAKWNGTHFDDLEGVDDQLVLKLALEKEIAGGTGEAFQVKQSFMLGTCYKSRESFKPYLHLGNLQVGDHLTDSNLFLHAFVTNGYNHGQYGEKLVASVRGDILTPKGIRMVDLGPRTDFRISKTKRGKFKLKVNGKQKNQGMSA